MHYIFFADLSISNSIHEEILINILDLSQIGLRSACFHDAVSAFFRNLCAQSGMLNEFSI